MAANLNQQEGIIASGSVLNIQGGVHFTDASAPAGPDILSRLLESLRFDGMEDRRYNVDEEFEGTCEWLLETPEWVRWQECLTTPDIPRLLWIKGKAGTGKSTVMKFAVDRGHIAEEDEIVLVHFFNARGTKLEKSTEGMYRTILVQLLERLCPDERPDPRFINSLLPRGSDWRLGKLKDLFSRLIRANSHRHITCFIDALDECDMDQARDMVGTLRSIVERKNRGSVNLRICFASRYYPQIAVPQGKAIEIPIEHQEGHKEDVINFINDAIVFQHSWLAGKAVAEIQERANGVFLWCDLVVKMLNKKHDQGMLSSADLLTRTLSEVPTELSDLIASVLGLDKTGLVPPSADMVLCMQIVLFAETALEPLELWVMVHLGLDKDQDNRCESPINLPRETQARAFILHVSRGLLEFKSAGSSEMEVQVIHESVRDFLLKNGGLTRFLGLDPDLPQSSLMAEAKTHERMRDIYLSRYMRKSGIKESLFFRRRYNSVFWHASRAQETGLADQSCFMDGLHRNWHLLTHPEARTREGRGRENLMALLICQGFPSLIRPLYRQSTASINWSVKWTLREIFSETQRNVNGNQMACFLAMIHEGIQAEETGIRCDLMQRLEHAVDWRDDPLSRSVDNPLPLLWHVASVDDALATCLLVMVVPDQRLEQISDAASIGFSKTFYKIVHDNICTLGDLFADKNEALIGAAVHGQVELVDLILHDSDVNINYLGIKGTALTQAIEAGCNEVVSFLLRQPGVDASARNPHDNTSLHIAARKNDVTAAGILVSRSETDLEAQNRTGYTPLWYGILFRSYDVCRLLIETHRVDVFGAMPNGSTPLHPVVLRGDLSTAHALLKVGMPQVLNANDRDGRTPKELAIELSAKPAGDDDDYNSPKRSVIQSILDLINLCEQLDH